MPTFSQKLTIWSPTKIPGHFHAPIGRASYPNLFKPRAMPGESEDKAKYSITVMFPKTTSMEPGKKLVREFAEARWGTNLKSKIKPPILDHADKTPDQELAREFPWIIRCSSDYAPEVRFANGEVCTATEEVYAGRWVWITIRPYTWEHPASGRGVSFGLSNVMLFDHDDRIGGGRAKIEDEFEDFFADGGAGGNGQSRSSLFD